MTSANNQLVAAYARAGERLRDLPFYNTRLHIEPVGFQPWNGRTIGVLVTPWFINVMLLPGATDHWEEHASGHTTEWELPAGRYEFQTCRLDGIGAHLSLPMFTTLDGFADQATARAIAAEALRRLLKPAQADRTSAVAPHARTMTRRRLLRGLTAEQCPSEGPQR
jgi:[NiFe] hydrogenase assembly HybE family chaperone